MTRSEQHEAGALRLPQAARKVLLLGLGNDILCDDAVGLHITREISRRLAADEDIETRETCEMGLSLLDFIVGYRDLVLVDAVQTGKIPPGQLHILGIEDLKVLPQMSPHFLGIGEILALGRTLGMPMPDRVKIFAVEVGDPFTLSTEMTAPVREAMPGIIEEILAELRHFAQTSPEAALPKPMISLAGVLPG